MRWYKFFIVLAIGLATELLFALPTGVLVRANGEWIASLTLPYFVPKSPLFFTLLTGVMHVSSALSLALYVEWTRDLPRGILLTVQESASEIIFLVFFFELTYEITSFFIATGCLAVSILTYCAYAKRNVAAGAARLPILSVKIYLWTALYCVLMLNFT